MTGYFVRIFRQGDWRNLDIADLTDRELRDFFEEQKPERVTQWAYALAGWIRDNVKPSPTEGTDK